MSQLARQAFEALLESLRHHEGPWRLHVFTHPEENPPVSPRRCLLVEGAIEDLLQKKQRRLKRTRVNDVTQPVGEDEALFQVLALGADAAYWSVTLPSDERVIGEILSRFPGGVAPTPDDQRPPSRAYKKLLETELHMGERIGEGQRCVDLGGSPGGWTFIAADRGAHVVSIDRSPLTDELMRHPRVAFQRGDAFRYAPDEPVDWLLCDVAAVPERSLEMLDTWLRAERCRRFCVTLKLKGDDPFAAIRDARSLLARHPVRGHVRQLAANKNEVTVFGTALHGG